MKKYEFDAEAAIQTIASDWNAFMLDVKATRVVIGISGGIDSTCVAALASKIVGSDNVYGLSMPCNFQHDLKDVYRVFDALKIKRLDYNIGDAYNNIVNGIESNGIPVTDLTLTNLPARLRMATLYAFALSLNAVVINTCNISESVCSYDTLFGDDCGSYAPIQRLTKSEVRSIARALTVVPEDLVMKTPIDGLQPATDELRFGYTYAELDAFIRTGVGKPDVIEKIMERYRTGGSWKMKMVNIRGPEFDLPNYVTGEGVE